MMLGIRRLAVGVLLTATVMLLSLPQQLTGFGEELRDARNRGKKLTGTIAPSAIRSAQRVKESARKIRVRTKEAATGQEKETFTGKNNQDLGTRKVENVKNVNPRPEIADPKKVSDRRRKIQIHHQTGSGRAGQGRPRTGHKWKHRGANASSVFTGNGKPDSDQQSDSGYASPESVGSGDVIQVKSNSMDDHVTQDGQEEEEEEEEMKFCGSSSSSSSGERKRCRNGGLCRFDAGLSVERCRCQLGFVGPFCETESLVKYPKFGGSGYVAFPVMRGAFREFTIGLDFRPDSDTGLLLFASDQPETRFDFFSVSIVEGRIDFRFDCGTGPAEIQTKNSVHLNQWNTLLIHRFDWNGNVRLNDGQEVRGRSKGLFSKMTFRDHLFLGGHKNLTSIRSRTGSSVGFSGCIRSLRVNRKSYDMRKGAFVGDALYGLDVAECNGRACDDVTCENGGTCSVIGTETSICLCPLGSSGDRCQTKLDILVPSFGGHSFLRFLGLRRSVLSFSEIEIVFRAADPDGLLLYNGYATDGSGDFISVALTNATVEYRFDLGTGPAIIRSPKPVDLGEWHVARVTRSGRTGYLQVDSQSQVEGSSAGAFTQMTLALDLFVGGHRNFDEIAKAAGVSRAFQGCIQKIVINEKPLKLLDDSLTGVNIDNCNHTCVSRPCRNGGTCVPLRDAYRCHCTLGFENTHCEDRVARYRYRYRYRRDAEEQKIEIPMFSGDGYLFYSDPEFVRRTRGLTTDVYMRIKSHSPDGLVFFVGEYETAPSSDYLFLGLVNGQLILTFNLGDGESVSVHDGTRLDDDRWHSVRASRRGSTAHLEVDGKAEPEVTSAGQLTQLQTDGTAFVGGLPDMFQRTRGRYAEGFRGCISNLTLSEDFRVDMVQEADIVSDVTECDVSMATTGG